MNTYYDNESESESEYDSIINKNNEIQNNEIQNNEIQNNEIQNNEIQNNINIIENISNKPDFSELSTDSDIDSNHTDNIDNMKKLVYQCVKYENEIKKINVYKKELNIKLKQIKTNLIPFMEHNEIDFININKKSGGGKLKYTKKKSFTSISKKYLFDSFKNFFNNGEQAQKLLDYLYENRQYKENVSIIKSKK